MPPAAHRPGLQRGRQRLFRRGTPRIWRQHPASGRSGLPPAPYFLTVCRFVPEKNLVRLIKAFARYRARCDPYTAWDLVICGDGPERSQLEQAIAAERLRTGDSLSRAFFRPMRCRGGTRTPARSCCRVFPSPGGSSSMKPPPAACRSWSQLAAGCAPALVPQPDGTTGSRFDPLDVEAMADKLSLDGLLVRSVIAAAMGERAAETVSHWGPDRFARGAAGSARARPGD